MWMMLAGGVHAFPAPVEGTVVAASAVVASVVVSVVVAAAVLAVAGYANPNLNRSVALAAWRRRVRVPFPSLGL